MRLRNKNVRKKILICTLTVFLVALVGFAGLVSYAYFSTVPRVYTEDGTKIARLGMNLSLLFDKLDPDEVDANTDLGILKPKTENEAQTTYGYDPSAKWGSTQNPYIISELRHLQNLSVLQNIGYFDQLYISQNYETVEGKSVYKGDGTVEIPGNPIMPYFLVCMSDGSTETIDGEGKTINPIGTDDHPFIGYIGGAFKSGTSTDVGNLNSDTSAIYNIVVQTNDNVVDVGLFGCISYLGNEPQYTLNEETGKIEYAENFAGAVSTVRDLLLADVQVKVVQRENNLIQFLAEHLFTYSSLTGDDRNKVAHEDHHIGILSGHVEYSTVEFISVYYSTEDKKAIDLLHSDGDGDETNDANYYSSTGIMGFVYNMNPTINPNGTIGTGSGTSGVDILLAANKGAGTGGGLASGTGRGYVTAADIFAKYSYTNENRDQGQIVWHYMYFEKDGHQVTNHGILIYEKKDGSGNKYYTLDDDQTEVEVKKETDGTMSATVGNNTWTNFLFRTGEGTEESPYEYRTYKPGTSEEVEPEDFHQQNLMIIDGADADGNKLCTEWIRNRIIGGTEATGRYYFYDGVFTFCLSSHTDVFRDTWKNNQAPEIILGENNDEAWKADTSKGNKAVVTYVKPIMGLTQLNDAIAAGKKIFIANQSGPAAAGMSMTMMSLANGSSDSGLADNAYRMTSTTQSIASEDQKASLLATLKNTEENGLEDLDGTNNQNLCAAIEKGEIFIIDLGSAEYLNELKNEYQISVTRNGNSYRFYGYNLSSERDNYLSLIHRGYNILGFKLDYYNVFCGTQSEAEGTRGFYSNVTDANLVYSDNDDDPYFRISFTNGEIRYVQYNGSGYFNGAENETDNGKMYFYTVEGMHNIDHGYITFVPEENTQYTSFIADQAILFPDTTYPGNAADTSTTYTLKTLAELNWTNAEGDTISFSPSDLHKKFNLTEAPGWGAMINLLGGTLDIGNSKQVVAPVGTNGVEANIPMGCVAFRINTDQPTTVRVIVAVPVSEFYEGDGQNDKFFEEDHRFGLWRVEAAGQTISTFSADQAIEQFELPRSNPYKPGTTPAGANSIEVKYGETTYRCYLNGLRVLVGYEFVIEPKRDEQGEITQGVEGVYVLGTTSGPMEIVHFSAGGTASAGRDGISGSKLGSIDFVYDYNGSIVTVKETSNTETEDYSKYYASMCLLYTDITNIKDNTTDPWQFYKINDQQITIRRTIGIVDEDTQARGSIINLAVASTNDASQTNYIKCAQYSMNSDKVNRDEDVQRG